MGSLSRIVAASLLGIACLTGSGSAQPTVDQGLAALLVRVEQALRSGDIADYLALLTSGADQAVGRQFADTELDAGVTKVVVRERDRVPLPGLPEGSAYRLMVEVLTERSAQGKVSTWRLDVEKSATAEWRIREQERLTTVEGLYRLTLEPTKQFAVRNLTIRGEDLTLNMIGGTAFVAEADGRPTILVLRGRGEMIFSPDPVSERTQLRIFCGAEVLRAEFDTAFIRMNPFEFDERISPSSLVPAPVDPGEMERASEIFGQFITKSFNLDLNDLSRDTWSLAPHFGDLLVEVRTRRFKTLTYARSGGEEEDVTLFDRERKRNIALYPSKQKLAARGRFYSEDDDADYDVLDYDIETTFDPDREWVDGRAYLRLKVRSYALATFTIRLAENLTVRSISSEKFGRLFGLRVRGQDNILINLPSALPRDTVLTLAMAYAGRIEPQRVDREAMGQQGASAQDQSMIEGEQRLVYSNRSYWYPQSTVSDYATGVLRLTVPLPYAVIATGELTGESPQAVAVTAESPASRRYMFVASQPVRYLSSVISRFVRTQAIPVAMKEPAAVLEAPDQNGDTDAAPADTPVRTGVFYDSLDLAVEANPRQQGRARSVSGRATDILQYFTSLLGDVPYQSFTLALVEDVLPGGHSPAYFALLNQPLPATPFVWRNDPVNFEGYPDFFLAHELAHQWWGQAVGWQNYHEQWLSEGFAQYFAALYARRDRGEQVFEGILRQMRRSALANSAKGPVYLGYRLGHLQGDSRIFRALVYNKGAAVLHMLRGLIGDEAFFRGLRRFYDQSRFRKVGSERLRAAFEAESERSLAGFFERWIYEPGIPTIAFSYRVDGALQGTSATLQQPRPAYEASVQAGGQPATPQEIVLRFQQAGELYELPVTVTLVSATGAETRVIVRLTELVTELRVPYTGRLRSVDLNSDEAALAEFKR